MHQITSVMYNCLVTHVRRMSVLSNHDTCGYYRMARKQRMPFHVQICCCLLTQLSSSAAKAFHIAHGR